MGSGRAHRALRELHIADEEPLAASWDPQPEPVPRHGPARRSSRLSQAVSTYGWRVYALPILVVLTALAALDVVRSPLSPPDQAGPSGATRNPLIPNPVSGPGFDAVKIFAELPGGGLFTVQGASTWQVIPGAGERVVINTARWARGPVAFQGNVVQYQQYVVNHEVGYGLGFPHIACDYLAALGTDHVTPDGLTCQPNAWPFPTIP